MSVTLPVVLGWIIDLNSSGPQFGDRIIEFLHSKADRAIGITHATRIRNGEMRPIRQREHVRFNASDLHSPKTEGVLNEPNHLGPPVRCGSSEDQAEYAHGSSLWHEMPLATGLSCHQSGPATRTNHGVDTGVSRGPRTILGNDQFPVVRSKGGSHRVEGDLHLTGRRSRVAGGRVDGLVSDK